MAQRKLNKRLIAILTLTGMVAVVALATVTTFSLTHRDPAVFAAQAKEKENKGEYEVAETFYKRAFDVPPKYPRYLIDASRCAYARGEVGQSIGLLRAANTQAPEDTEILNALLDRYWDLNRAGQAVAEGLKEASEKLLALQPDNLLALISRANALLALPDPSGEGRKQADADFERAAQLDPKNPRVALLKASRAMRVEGKLSPEQIKEQAPARRARALAILEEAYKENPRDPQLSLALAEILHLEGQDERCQEILKNAADAQPDAIELQLNFARFLLMDGQARMRKADAAGALTQARAGLERALRAIQIDRAAFEGYSMRGDLQKLIWEASGEWEKDRAAHQKQILADYLAALTDTVGLKSPRATLGNLQRLELITHAFDLALAGYRDAGEDKKLQAEFIEVARQLSAQARQRYPETFFTPMLESQLAVLDNDPRRAIQLLQTVESRTSDPGFAANSVALRYRRMAKENLALLLRQSGEPGLALRYNDEALRAYKELNQDAPRILVLARGDLLLALDRNPEAVDLAEAMLRQSPDDVEFRRVLARAQARLKQLPQATRTLEGASEGNVGLKIDAARINAAATKYEEAERILREVLAANPGNAEALRLTVQVMRSAKRDNELRELLQASESKVTDDATRRTISAYLIAIDTPDEKEREAKILALIGSIQDPVAQAAELYTYWIMHEDLAKAGAALDEMEKLKPDDLNVKQEQFQLNVRRKNFDRAEQYGSKLTQLNFDHAGGATYRGQLKLVRGDPAGALVDLRAAERELPTDSDVKVRVAQAILLDKAPRYDEAIESLKQALEFNPNDFAANRLLYLVYEQLGREQEGTPYLLKAVALNPNEPEMAKRAAVAEEEREPKKGIEKREKDREKDPNNITNLLRLVQLYGRVHDDGKAEECLQAAFKLKPDDVRTANAAAKFYSERRNREAGEKILAAFVASQKGQAKVDGQILLARFYETLGDPAAALATLNDTENRIDQFIAEPDQRKKARISLNAEIGEYHARHGNPTDMVNTYRKVLTLIPPVDVQNIQGVRLKIIKGLLSVGDAMLPEAEREANAFLKDFPKDIRGQMAQGELLIKQRKLPQAHDVLTAVLAAQPQQPWSLFMRGALNIDLRNYPEARDDLLKVKRLAPDAFNNAHRLELARLYQLMDQNTLAENELRELLQSDPANADLGLRMVRLFKATDQYPKAQQFVAEQIARQPQQTLWPYQMGLLLTDRQDFSGAAPYFQKAAELSRFEVPELVANYLRSLARGGRSADVVRVVEGLSAPQRAPIVLAYAAEGYAKASRAAEARSMAQEALAEGAKQGVVRLNEIMGAIVDALDLADAEQALRQAMEKQSSDPSCILRLKNVLARTLIESKVAAKAQEGEKLVRENLAAAADPSDERTEAMLIDARAAEIAGQVDRAIAIYEKVVAVRSDMVGPLNNLAFLLADRAGRPKEAIPYVERARQLTADRPNANVLDTLGWVYFLAGDAGRAEGALVEASQIDPQNLAALDHLGQVYVKGRQTAEARKTYQRLLETAQKSNNAEYRQKAQDALARLQ